MPEVITDNLDLWTSALLTKSSAGRGSNGKLEAYGIKKLRELILELAVRGKLVPQDPSDEVASALLKQTVTEKKRLIKEGVIRESKPPVFPAEPPDHQLPASWVWTNLFEIGEIAPRNEADDKLEASFVPMLAISEKYGTPVQHDVKPWGEIKSGFTHFREEDVVLAKITPCFQNGKSAVMRGLTNGFGAGTTELHVYRAINACTIPEYVLVYLKSPRFIGDGIPKMTGTAGQKRITRDYFAGNHFPLPSLAEQHRIVAKVDELMALCDQLEQQQTDSLAAHQVLVETLLGTLTRVASQQEFSAAWARIASHFDTLFTTEASIDQLKQTILQLAVMGKLVPQDPNDEPASELLKRIQEEKAHLIAQGLIKQETRTPDVAADEKPYALPTGWEYARLADLTSVLNGRAYAKDELLDVGTPVLRVGNLFTSNQWYYSNLELEEDKYCDAGDLLFAWSASFGPFLWKGPKVIYHYHIWKLKLHSEANLSKFFLYKFLLEKTEEMKASGHGVSMIHMTKQAMEKIVVPVPPFAEQHRIVAKVDELMALCDALKARLANAKTTQIHLADAIVEQAVC